MNVIATCILYCLSVTVCLELERSIHNDVIADLTRYRHGNHMYSQSRILTYMYSVYICHGYSLNIFDKKHTCEVS